MNIQLINSNQWDSIESIYMEAFPKRERKPFRSIQKSANKKRAQLFALFKFYRGKRPAITWGGIWHQCQTPPLTLLRGIIRV